MAQSIAITAQTHIKRNKELIWRTVEDHIVILDIEKSTVFELNDTASYIWKSTSRPIAFKQLIKKIVDTFDISEKKALVDAKTFLQARASLFILFDKPTSIRKS